MPHSSPNSAGAIYLDLSRRIAELEAAAVRAQRRMPEIRRVLLFGSLARGTASPRSDADLLVVVERSRHAQSRDRIPEVLAALAPLPGPIDLFVVTAEELAAATAAGAPLVREALAGVDLVSARGA